MILQTFSCPHRLSAHLYFFIFYRYFSFIKNSYYSFLSTIFKLDCCPHVSGIRENLNSINTFLSEYIFIYNLHWCHVWFFFLSLQHYPVIKIKLTILLNSL